MYLLKTVYARVGLGNKQLKDILVAKDVSWSEGLVVGVTL